MTLNELRKLVNKKAPKRIHATWSIPRFRVVELNTEYFGDETVFYIKEVEDGLAWLVYQKNRANIAYIALHFDVRKACADFLRILPIPNLRPACAEIEESIKTILDELKTSQCVRNKMSEESGKDTTCSKSTSLYYDASMVGCSNLFR